MNKQKKRKILTIVLVAILTLSSNSVLAKAMYVSSAIAANSSVSSTRADVIVYKWREYYGKIQYRRWNETRGYWVDPYWIDAP